MKIKYIHNLEYSYEESVQLGEHRLCIKPRSHGFQRLINFDLHITPKPKILYPLLSASGEEIYRITFEGYSNSLSIKAVSEVETLIHPDILDGVKERDLTLVVKTADCMPVLICDEEKIGVIHIGWKGLENNIFYKTICYYTSMVFEFY